MPLSYRIDPLQGIVTITGDYTDAAGWRELLSEVSRDPHYRPGFGFLRDLRASTHPVSSQVVKGIIGVVREFWATLGTSRAAIVTGHGIDYPALIAEALADDEQLALRAFTSYDEAVSWLNEGRSSRER